MEASSSNTKVSSSQFDTFNAQLQASALKATTNALALPADAQFHRSIDPAFAEGIDDISSRVLRLTNKLLNLSMTPDQLQNGRGKGKAKLENQDDVVDNFQSLVADAMDQQLERTDTSLDVFLGRLKAPAISIKLPAASSTKMKTKPSAKGYLDSSLHHAAHLRKPQLTFKTRPSNDDTPWYPSLTHKFNAKVPLGFAYNEDESRISEPTIANHPYRYEITHYSAPLHVYIPGPPVPPQSFEKTPFTWVNTPTEFRVMISKLKKSREIAVDLEHHSYRTYLGFLCLMQVSDRNEDWVIDLLALREEVSEINEVFTDPDIIKVLHGADSDIVWLQQDFSVYIVGLFDTYHASKLLEFPRHGLGNLLEMYCDYIPDKRYQLADWRIRPLTEEMLQYARSDTHFLLFIYDNLRHALIDRARSSTQSHPSTLPLPNSSPTANKQENLLINLVLRRSAEVSLKIYTKNIYDIISGSGSGGWDSLAKRWNKGALTAEGPRVLGEREVYKALHLWRDNVAREEDESVRYVLSNHYLFQLAEQPPADTGALLNIFKNGGVPPVIKRRANELIEVIREGVRAGLGGTGREKTEKKIVLDVENTADIILQISEMQTSVEQEKKEVTLGVGDARGLWSTKVSCMTPVSSLFGHSKKSTQKRTAVQTSTTMFCTKKSSLFGFDIGTPEIKSNSGSVLHPDSAKAPLFAEIVKRINGTLVIAPGASKMKPFNEDMKDALTKPSQVEEGNINMIAGQEMAFIPVTHRILKTEVTENDSIVVVGRAREKKRKRIRSTPLTGKVGNGRSEGTNAGHGAGGAGAQSESKDSDMQFDFTSVSNILDEDPDEGDPESRKKRRQRKQGAKRGGVYYGDFPAPPKAYSEPKNGNQSHTFK